MHTGTKTTMKTSDRHTWRNEFGAVSDREFVGSRVRVRAIEFVRGLSEES